MRVDVHQHLWTQRLYRALARRDEAPRLRARAGGWELELAGEPPFPLAREPQDAERRVEALGDLGADLALVSLSTALGVETLPGDEAREIIAAWDEDADVLPARLPAWGSVGLSQPDPYDVDRALDRGRVGITLPASGAVEPRGDRVGRRAARAARGA